MKIELNGNITGVLTGAESQCGVSATAFAFDDSGDSMIESAGHSVTVFGRGRNALCIHARVELDKRAERAVTERASGLSELYSSGPRSLFLFLSTAFRVRSLRGDRYHGHENATVPLAVFQSCGKL